jgi:hypothetical protein
MKFIWDYLVVIVRAVTTRTKISDDFLFTVSIATEL